MLASTFSLLSLIHLMLCIQHSKSFPRFNYMKCSLVYPLLHLSKYNNIKASSEIYLTCSFEESLEFIHRHILRTPGTNNRNNLKIFFYFKEVLNSDYVYWISLVANYWFDKREKHSLRTTDSNFPSKKRCFISENEMAIVAARNFPDNNCWQRTFDESKSPNFT